MTWRKAGLLERDSASVGDQVSDFSARRVIEERLRRLAQLLALLGDEDERTLNLVGAVLDGLLRGRDAIHRDSLDGVVHRRQRSVTECIRVCRDARNDCAGARQLLLILAGIFNANDALEAVARARTCLTADQDDRGVVAADLAPVGDGAVCQALDLLERQVSDRVLVVYDDGNAVEREGGGG